MIDITDKELFAKVVSDAIEAAVTNSKDDQTANRWTRAINRAVEEIETNPYLTWEADKQSLLILSPRSNNIYSSNGVCQCIAFEMQTPCWHRASARLIRLYFEALDAPIAPPPAKTAAMPIPAQSPLKVVDHEDERAIYITPYRPDEKVGGFRL